jgi:hypothetical protein
MSSRHLVDLPVRFQPKPTQDVMQRPSVRALPPQRSHWQVTTDGSAPASPMPQPVTPPPVPAPEPARLGAWQRLLRWWRGY